MFQTAIEEIKNGETVAFAIAIVLGVLLNAKNLLAFTHSYKKRRIELLKEAIATENLDERLRNHFRDEMEGEYFRLTHKTRIDKGLRDACLTAYSKLQKNVSFSHFVRARSHLEVENNELHVRITLLDSVSAIYNLLTGIVLIFFGFALLAIIPTIEPTSINSFAITAFAGLSLIAAGFFVLFQISSYVSAKILEKSLKTTSPMENPPDSA